MLCTFVRAVERVVKQQYNFKAMYQFPFYMYKKLAYIWRPLSQLSYTQLNTACLICRSPRALYATLFKNLRRSLSLLRFDFAIDIRQLSTTSETCLMRHPPLVKCPPLIIVVIVGVAGTFLPRSCPHGGGFFLRFCDFVSTSPHLGGVHCVTVAHICRSFKWKLPNCQQFYLSMLVHRLYPFFPELELILSMP